MPAAGLAHISLGELLYERNDLAGAAQALAYGTDLLRGSIEQYVLAHGYVTLARVQLARGEGEGAFATLQRGEAWFTQMQVTALGAETLLALGKALLWLEQGQLAAVAHWVQSCKWWPEETNLGYLQRLTLVRLRLAQSRSDPQDQFLLEATETLSRLLVLAEAGGWLSQIIEILVLQALVCRVQGDSTGALTTLERALTLAEPEGYIRLFVDEGKPMAELLARMNASREGGGMKEYVYKLLAAFAEEQGSREIGEKSPLLPLSSAPMLVEPLSERELEVLGLIAAGLSNQEIAQKLVVALSTVKKHINNIYTKLGVKSRTQALVQARELKLL
jgi:LuxR family maltose regulon positive regulatory protein